MDPIKSFHGGGIGILFCLSLLHQPKVVVLKDKQKGQLHNKGDLRVKSTGKPAGTADSQTEQSENKETAHCKSLVTTNRKKCPDKRLH